MGEGEASPVNPSQQKVSGDASPLQRQYADIPGFCKSTTLAEITANGYVLTPGRYVGAEELEDDDEPFEQKMARLTAQLETQFEESMKLEMLIKQALKTITR